MIQGSLYMIVAFFFMALFGLFQKIGQIGTTALWMAFIAFFSGFVVACAQVWKEGFSSVKTARFFLHFLRGFFGVIATFLFVISLQYIPLVNATLFFNATPLFIPIFSRIILKAQVPRKVWVAVLIGFVGIVCMIRPNFHTLGRPGDLIGLGSGFFLALAMILIKILSKTEPTRRINFYAYGYGALLLLPFLFFSTPFPLVSNIGWGVLAGVSMVLVQTLLVQAYRHAEPHHIGVFQYMSVVYAGIFDWVIWDQTPS
ncbi:MAG: DMT family transporter, partial [Chlamydiia bacterium]|nr:DMT family transporter [Chlamydiia bacterium]